MNLHEHVLRSKLNKCFIQTSLSTLCTVALVYKIQVMSNGPFHTL